MKVEIYKIIEADETARRRLEAARVRALKEREQAQRTADEIIASKTKDASASKNVEIEGIISEARSKAQSISEEADRCIEKLSTKKMGCFKGLMDRLLERVTGF